MSSLKVTSIEDVKKRIAEDKAGKPVQLPSGLVFRLTRPTVSHLIRTDAIPSELMSAALSLDAGQVEPKTKEDYLRSMKVIDMVAMESCMEPKLSLPDDPKDGTINIADLSDDDRIAIYLYAQTGVEPALKSFRDDANGKDAGSGVPTVPGSTAQ